MQGQDDLEPTVRIRELKKDRVNFVLENVDLACVHSVVVFKKVAAIWADIRSLQVCEFIEEGYDG